MNIRTLTRENIILMLNGNLQTGMCNCPAHKDTKPSLHISEKNGKVLWKCFGGCPQEQVRRAIFALRSLTPRDPSHHDEYRRQKSMLAAARAEAMQAEAHTVPGLDEYRRRKKASALLRAGAYAEAGKPLEYLRGRGIELVPDAVMLLPKSESHRLTGTNSPAMVVPMINGDKLVGAHVTFLTRDCSAKVPGRTPRKMFGPTKGGYMVLREAEPDKPLLIAEGIETGLSASQIAGVPAIAAGSSGSMQAIGILPPCSEIIIAADHDDPGLKAAKVLAQRLANEGRVVRIAKPEVDGDDWNDVLRKDGRNPIKMARLREQILTSKVIKPQSHVLAMPANDFMALTFPPRPLHLNPWLSKGSISMIHAERGAGKTWFVLSVAYAISANRPLLNWRCEQPGKVLYIDGELPGEFLQKRLKLFGDMPEDLLILSRDQFHQRRQNMPDLATPEGRDALDHIIERQQPDVIIFDSISTLVRSGVENDAESWAPIQDWLMHHRWRGRTSVLVHHEGRGGGPVAPPSGKMSSTR